MIAALNDDFPPAGGWTTGDLDELPEDGHRRELIDGVLIVTPTPTYFHQSIAMRLGVALETNCPDEFVVTQGVEVRVSTQRSLIPDVLVVSYEATSRTPSKFSPHEVLLAIEIVSPGSQTLDRFAKPALYAEAGIPFYWCIETVDDVNVTAYHLDVNRQVYVQSGLFTTSIDISQPWPINIPISHIVPRRSSRS